MKPILSVAIATKDREKYCIAVIDSILSYNDPRLQIAIADNSNSTQVKDYVESLNSPYITYSYDNSQISSIDNFNKAISISTGEFLTLLGDDDVILPEMIDAVIWMKENNVDTLTPSKYLTYFWPGSRPQSPNGTLYIPSILPSLQKVDALQELIKLSKNGLTDYHNYKIAKSYHGVVKRELMNEIKRMTGNYYGALSPDIFSVVTLSSITKQHYFATFPLSIAGVCRSSTSSNQLFGEHVGRLENMPHLKNRAPYDWDRMIPRFYCVTNTWAESGLHALKAINATDVIKKFQIYPVVAIGILMNYKHIFKFSIVQSEQLRKELEKPFLLFWTLVCLSICKQLVKKVVSSIKNKFGKKDQIFNDVPDIAHALDKYLELNIKSAEIKKLLSVVTADKK